MILTVCDAYVCWFSFTNSVLPKWIAIINGCKHRFKRAARYGPTLIDSPRVSLGPTLEKFGN